MSWDIASQEELIPNLHTVATTDQELEVARKQALK